MSSHTLVPYLQKDPATRRILCLFLQLLSFYPGHHLHRESKPCVYFSKGNTKQESRICYESTDSKHTHALTHSQAPSGVHASTIAKNTRRETLSVNESQKISFLSHSFPFQYQRIFLRQRRIQQDLLLPKISNKNWHARTHTYTHSPVGLAVIWANLFIRCTNFITASIHKGGHLYSDSWSRRHERERAEKRSVQLAPTKAWQ